MTILVRCDTCGRIQESGPNNTNPINPDTNEKWYSRTIACKEEHACKESCIKSGLVWPKWAY